MHGLVDGLQRLQALGHEEVGELELDVVHPRRVLQDPLLVRVRGVVVGHGVVVGGVEVAVGVLGRGVFGAVRRRVAQHHHDGRRRVQALACLQEVQPVVGDHVRVVVPWVLVAVLDPVVVPVDGVVVVAGVHEQPRPLAPPDRHVRPVVLVQVLPEVTRPVSGVVEVGGEGAALVRLLPHGRGAVLVVGVHLVVMDVHSGEDGRTRRTAHGRCGVGLREVGAPVLHEVHQLRHVVERTEFDVLVVGENEDDVGPLVPSRKARRPVRRMDPAPRVLVSKWRLRRLLVRLPPRVGVRSRRHVLVFSGTSGGAVLVSTCALAVLHARGPCCALL